MKIKYLGMVLFVMISVDLFSDSGAYHITTLNKDEDIKLVFSREFFVNDIYLDFFVPFGLDNACARDEIVSIFDELYRDLSVNYGKMLKIPVDNDNSLCILFKSYRIGDNISLVVMTNYDLVNRSLISPGADFSNCYGRQYFILNNGLVPGYIFYMQDKVNEAVRLRESGDFNGLADFYLFDDIAANDGDIPGIISEGLKAPSDQYHSCLLRLTQAQYFLFKSKYAEASESLALASRDAESLSDARQKAFIQASVKQMKDIMDVVTHMQQGQ